MSQPETSQVLTNWVHRTQVRSARKKASKRLATMAASARYRCHWCGTAIVVVSSVPSKRRIGIADGMLTYRTEAGEEITLAVATSDHLRPLNQGGDSAADNLVAACQKCNTNRGGGRP